MKKPNVVWICTDQQRYDTINKLGNPWIKTPNLNKLCERGVAFSRAYCQSPICTPSRASFMTGLYPSCIPSNKNGNKNFRNNGAGVSIVSRIFKEAGYQCGLVGKLHLASAFKGVENRIEDGYDFFKYSHAPFVESKKDNQYAQWLEQKGWNFDQIFEKDGHNYSYYSYRENVDPDLRQTKWCVDQSMEFIKKNCDAPFFLNLNFFDPHVPFDAPDSYIKRYMENSIPKPKFRESDLEAQQQLKDIYFQTNADRPGKRTFEQVASYYGMIELIDEQVGRILNCLDDLEIRDETIVIFMSDHGEMLGDHGLVKKGCRFYDGLVRVPLIISWPGTFSEGRVDDGLVELTDITPTLCEIIEHELLLKNGISLLQDLINGGSERQRDFVRCEYYDAVKTNQDGGFPGSYGTMYCDGKYKLCIYHNHGIGELFDLKDDPDEFNNLWGDHKYQKIKNELILESYRQTVRSSDLYEEIGGYY